MQLLLLQPCSAPVRHWEVNKNSVSSAEIIIRKESVNQILHVIIVCTWVGQRRCRCVRWNIQFSTATEHSSRCDPGNFSLYKESFQSKTIHWPYAIRFVWYLRKQLFNSEKILYSEKGNILSMALIFFTQELWIQANSVKLIGPKCCVTYLDKCTARGIRWHTNYFNSHDSN